MSTSLDPFGFTQQARPGASSNVNTILVQPGQEIRVVVADASGGLPAGLADNRASPSGSGDSRASPSGKGDSRSSPSGKGDAFSLDAFGFGSFQPGFSPRPMTLVVQPGQELRIVASATNGGGAPPGDSRASPSPKGD